jgi:hypothetical protein
VIQAVGVVVPARDEEDLLPSCLAAVDLAARLIVGVTVNLIVVADTCSDHTTSCRHGLKGNGPQRRALSEARA